MASSQADDLGELSPSQTGQAERSQAKPQNTSSQRNKQKHQRRRSKKKDQSEAEENARNENTEVSDNMRITDLSQLKQLDKESYLETFVHCLNVIFQYAARDIEDCLNKRGMETLSPLHWSLCKKVIELFPEYQNRRTVNRTPKHKCITDIMNMGMTLVSESPTKGMDKIFIEQQTKSNEGQDSLLQPEPTVADLIVTVAELSDRLKRVESELEILKQSPTKDSAGTTATRE